MSRYRFFLSFILISFYLIGLYFDTIAFKKIREAKLQDLNTKIVEIQNILTASTEDFHHTLHTLWGLKKNPLLLRRLNEKESSKHLLKVDSSIIKKMRIKNRVVCLGKECWEFMGIVSSGDSISVTLVSKDKKMKLKIFKVGDFLLKHLKIIHIDFDNVTLFDTHEKKNVKLKLFDVDVSQYSSKKVD